MPTNDRLWENDVKALRAQKPRHILFMCVANSARSQLAEGLARALAPSSCRISSAGSNPGVLHPLAMEVMKEIGVDISGHHSKDISSVDSKSVDVVITLCAEEVCPTFLGPAMRLHWGMPDPASAGSSPDERRQAFRIVRDELKRRLEMLFSGWTDA